MLNLLYDPVTLKNVYNSTLLTGEEGEKLEQEYQKMFKEHLNFEDGGLTVYSKTKSNIELSKGCQSCKHGKWLCVFVGYNCNLQCAFCPQPKEPNYVHVFDENHLTSHGTLSELKYYLSTDDTIEGVSYSGGEPLLYFNKIISMASYIHENCPNIYQWIYTNGILLDEAKLQQLKEVGIDEIRLDLAATKFNKEIIDKIPLVKKYIKRVAVEIPAIAEIKVLMENNLLDELVSMGLEQLNLSEMTLTQQVNMENYGRDTVLVGHKGFYKGLSLLESKEIYYEILDYVIKHDLDLLVNNCHYGAKTLQLMNRQRNQKLYKS